MKKTDNLLDKISKDKILQDYTINKVYGIITKPETEIFPQFLKATLYITISWLISLYSVNRGYIFPLLSTVILLSIFIFYTRSPLYLKNSRYALLKYMCIQNSFIFYVSAINVTENNRINTIVSTVYIVIGYLMSMVFCKIKIENKIQEKYSSNKTYIRTNKNIKKITIWLTSVLTVIFGLMQIYRISKWWINNNNLNFLSILNGTILGDVFSILSVSIAVLILISITLIPTLFLDYSLLADGYILKHFSKVIRIAHEFTETEWYGDN